jgi:hypothetical protein
MFERSEEHRVVAATWTAALATLVVSLRGGSVLLLVMSLTLAIAASRVTWLQTRRRQRARRQGAPSAPVARVTRLRPRTNPGASRGQSAA